MDMIRLFLADDAPAPLILPDSVQKARLAQTVDKIMHLDYQEVLSGLLSQLVWVGLKLLLALAIYFVGRWIVRRVVRLLDITFEKRHVDTSLRSFLRNTVRVVFSLVLLIRSAARIFSVNVVASAAIRCTLFLVIPRFLPRLLPPALPHAPCLRCKPRLRP